MLLDPDEDAVNEDDVAGGMPNIPPPLDDVVGLSAVVNMPWFRPAGENGGGGGGGENVKGGRGGGEVIDW